MLDEYNHFCLKRICIVVNGLVTIPTVIFSITIHCMQDNEHYLINKMTPFYVITHGIYFILIVGCYIYFIPMGFIERKASSKNLDVIEFVGKSSFF